MDFKSVQNLVLLIISTGVLTLMKACRHNGMRIVLLTTWWCRFIVEIIFTRSSTLSVHYHISILYVIIVSIGFLHFFEFGVTTAYSAIRLYGQIRRARISKKIIQLQWLDWKVLLVSLVTFYSLFTVVRMFLFVREFWTIRLGIIIECLHVFPAGAVAAQTVASGTIVCLKNLLAQRSITKTKDYRDTVNTLLWCNGGLCFYAVLNAVIDFWFRDQWDLLVVMAIEIICRILFICWLWSPPKQQDPRTDNVAVAPPDEAPQGKENNASESEDNNNSEDEHYPSTVNLPQPEQEEDATDSIGDLCLKSLETEPDQHQAYVKHFFYEAGPSEAAACNIELEIQA